MKFSITDTLPFPRERVYLTHRDKLSELAEYLPNIASITVESREDDGSVVRLVNIWKAAESEIPGLARPFIKPNMLRWIDRAVWDISKWEVRWETELGFLPEAIEAHGCNTFVEDDDESATVTIHGEIIIHADRIPGVPRIMSGQVSKAVEAFVVKLIQPNLRKTNEGVRHYLEDHEE